MVFTCIIIIVVVDDDDDYVAVVLALDHAIISVLGVTII